jgi:hypothetical protein
VASWRSTVSTNLIGKDSFPQWYKSIYLWPMARLIVMAHLGSKRCVGRECCLLAETMVHLEIASCLSLCSRYPWLTGTTIYLHFWCLSGRKWTDEVELWLCKVVYGPQAEEASGKENGIPLLTSMLVKLCLRIRRRTMATKPLGYHYSCARQSHISTGFR